MQGAADPPNVKKLESVQQIIDGKEFFEKYFQNIIEALDNYLMDQFGEWFEQFNKDLKPSQSPSSP